MEFNGVIGSFRLIAVAQLSQATGNIRPFAVGHASRKLSFNV
jgi:hypothetical protein